MSFMSGRCSSQCLAKGEVSRSDENKSIILLPGEQAGELGGWTQDFDCRFWIQGEGGMNWDERRLLSPVF